MESQTIIFEEVQGSRRMKHKWFYGTIAIIFAAVLIVNHFSARSIPAFTVFLWAGFIIFLLLQIFFSLGFQLTTQIRDDGIYVRFPPYQAGFTRFAWEDIEEIHIRKFNPAKEYGYGVRLGPDGYGYTVPGDTGIYLVLKKQLPVMISTKCPEQWVEMLRKIGRIK